MVEIDVTYIRSLRIDPLMYAPDKYNSNADFHTYQYMSRHVDTEFDHIPKNTCIVKKYTNAWIKVTFLLLIQNICELRKRSVNNSQNVYYI